MTSLLFVLFLATQTPVAETPAEESRRPLASLEFRNIGPAVMGGRVSDVEGVAGDPRVVYAAASSGGVWKTTDGGIEWAPIFDDQPVASIGDIALEPGNPNVVYVGTGEANLRNSVSFGNGVYKSTDGGDSWRHLGLEETRHISRIVVDPKDPARVFVGAMGHAFGPNEERGVYRSVDGGGTWENVLYVDERHGVSDLEIDPTNPNILYAAFWHFERRPWTLTSGSEEGGVYKSTDGGTSWTQLTKGLPKLLGRIGVKVAPSAPHIVYVIAESKEGTLFRSTDRGQSFAKVSDDIAIVSRGFYFADLRIDPTNDNRLYALSGALRVSIDGGKSFERISRSMHSDYHGLWIDPLDPHRMWQAQDGGIGVTYNRGESWEYIDVLPISQYYAIFVDQAEPFYHVGGGMQDNATWRGPSRNGEPVGILDADWREISNGDGFQAVTHPDDPEITLTEYQGGRIVRTDNRTRETVYVSPYAPSMGGAPAGDFDVRFNWNAPIIASPHDAETVYFAGNKVFRSEDFGTTWTTVSPDLTTNDPEKMGAAGGPLWPENTTAEYHCTIISLAESPVAPGVLWAGTDDGNLQLSRDAGASWTNVVANVSGLSASSPVSHVEPSRTEAATAYVSFDRHMFDDLAPYVYKTDDFGATWTNISGDLPEGAYVWVLRQDPRVPELVYAGTELGLYVTRDDGASWNELHLKNFPTVAVHDLIVHPRDNDLIVGTHGRGMWIFDDATPLQNMTDDIMERPSHLFPIRRAIRFSVKPTRYGIGDKKFLGPNPPYGALITYSLSEALDEDSTLKLEILDVSGEVLREIDELSRDAGAHRVAWDLNLKPRKDRKPEPPKREPNKGEEAEAERGPAGPRVPPGRYRARLTVGDEVHEEPLDVVMSPAAGIDDSDLDSQFQFTKRLWEMQSETNVWLRGLDSVKSQIDDRDQAASAQERELSEALEASLTEHVGRIEELSGTLAMPELTDHPAVGEPPRHFERLSDLFRSTNSVNAAPTPAQEEYLAELVSNHGGLASEVRAYLESLEELNTALAAEGLPGVLVPES